MKTDNTNTTLVYTKKTEKAMCALFVGVWVFGLIAMVALNAWVF